MVDLKSKPFNLNADDVQWVQSTLASMTLDEKVGQLFCLAAYNTDEAFLKNIAQNVRPAGMMCRPMNAAEIVDVVTTLQNNSSIPMLIAANLERGGSGVAKEATTLGPEMQIAATGDAVFGERLGTICGSEAAALGVNWAFAPIIDIDYNFRNPITNTRTFGSDPRWVRRLGVEYVRAVQKHGLAASIKHFPGDGMDERDQHLVTSINSLTCSEWDRTYGAAYKECIEAGAMTVMVGHILQPAYIRKLNSKIADEDMLPATLSYELCTKLLREKLEFNGLVVSDAMTMAGVTIPMPRWEMVPRSIAAGCDIFLFTRNMDEDLAFMRKGIDDGIISEQRLQDALTRILGLKAALGLHKKKAAGNLIPTLDRAMSVLNSEEHKGWAKECADKAITLVKEEPNVLPLSAERYKKVLFYPIEAAAGFEYTVRTGVVEEFKHKLAQEGFEVDQFVPNPELGFEGLMESYLKIAKGYDLIVYLANMATKSNQTTVRIEWAQPMGMNVPIFMSTVPTIFISVENPYHLIDVPRVRTYINTYSSTDTVLDALIDKLMGRSAFKGKSPVDPFCGMWDTKLS